MIFRVCAVLLAGLAQAAAAIGVADQDGDSAQSAVDPLGAVPPPVPNRVVSSHVEDVRLMPSGCQAAATPVITESRAASTGGPPGGASGLLIQRRLPLVHCQFQIWKSSPGWKTFAWVPSGFQASASAASKRPRAARRPAPWDAGRRESPSCLARSRSWRRRACKRPAEAGRRPHLSGRRGASPGLLRCDRSPSHRAASPAHSRPGVCACSPRSIGGGR